VKERAARVNRQKAPTGRGLFCSREACQQRGRAVDRQLELLRAATALCAMKITVGSSHRHPTHRYFTVAPNSV
jgi:hypothetical protein